MPQIKIKNKTFNDKSGESLIYQSRFDMFSGAEAS